jgi:hypothetical protein
LWHAALGLLLVLAPAAWRLPALSSVRAAGVTEAVWSGYYIVPGTSSECELCAGSTYIQIIPADSHTLTRFLAWAPEVSGCSTYGAVGLEDLTTGTVLATLQFGEFTVYYDSGALSVSMTAGHTFAFVVTQNALSCAYGGGLVTFAAVYEGASGAVTEATWSGYYDGALSAPFPGPEVVLANSHTLTRFLVTAEESSGCPNNVVVALKDVTSGTVLTSLTVTDATDFYDSGPLSISMVGGHTFEFLGTQGSGNCTGGTPETAGFTAVFQ